MPEQLARAHRRPQLRAGRLIGSRPASHWHRLLTGRVCERVAEGHQIEDVVGVEMADQNGVDVDVITEATQLGKNPVAAVEQQRELPMLDQVPAAGTVDVLP